MVLGQPGSVICWLRGQDREPGQQGEPQKVEHRISEWTESQRETIRPMARIVAAGKKLSFPFAFFSQHSCVSDSLLRLRRPSPSSCGWALAATRPFTLPVVIFLQPFVPDALRRPQFYSMTSAPSHSPHTHAPAFTHTKHASSHTHAPALAPSNDRFHGPMKRVRGAVEV
jgi:hypothetical protein